MLTTGSNYWFLKCDFWMFLHILVAAVETPSSMFALLKIIVEMENVPLDGVCVSITKAFFPQAEKKVLSSPP
jgi:hypothetical protein